MRAIEHLHTELVKRGRAWGDENAARLTAVRQEMTRRPAAVPWPDRRIVDRRQVQRIERGRGE